MSSRMFSLLYIRPKGPDVAVYVLHTHVLYVLGDVCLLLPELDFHLFDS